MNGCKENNKILREKIIDYLKPDILCVSETHLEKDEQICIDGYKYFEHNRKFKHIRALKIYGGIGIFVTYNLCDVYKIHIIDKSLEGILGLKFTDKVSGYNFIIYACYLAPDNSPYGKNSTEFFGHLTAQLYLNNDADQIYLCGDLNGRVGNLEDTVPGIDHLPQREVIDQTVQGHGETLIGFINDCRLCILNGRFKPEENNFTCISTKGKSVVDYILIPHDVFDKVGNFKVYTMNDMCDRCHLAQYIGDRCHLPDHSILAIEVNIDAGTNASCDVSTSNDSTCTSNIQRENVRRYNFDTVPDYFMTSDSWKQGMNELIDLFLICQNRQDEIDNAYEQFCTKVKCEMDQILKYTDSSKKVRKKYKNYKPYWNEELHKMWKDMSHAEKLFTNCRGPRHRKEYLRVEYAKCKGIFDKALRRAERNYRKHVVDEIESCCVNDPRKFWNHISNLGPRKKKDIPMRVYDVDGNACENMDFVLNKWKNDFSDLYNSPGIDIETDNFYRHVNQMRINMENNMEDDEYLCNDFINNALSFDEIERVVNKLKSKKAPGIDTLPNEVLKQNDVMILLFHFYTKCFE